MSLLENEDPDKPRFEVKIEEVVELTVEQLKAISGEQNYYRLLDVSPQAEEAEIQASYKSKALRLHPDRHAHSPHPEAYQEAFNQLATAKKTLLDPAARRKYDATRGLAKGKKKWSMEALMAQREKIDEDYQKVDYAVYQEAQLERAKMYHEYHESEKVMAFGYIMRQARAEVLAKKREHDWNDEETAEHATKVLGKIVGASEIPEWEELERTGKDTDEGMSREELEKESGVFNEKGKFVGFRSFQQFADVVGVTEQAAASDADREIVSGAGADLQAAILAVREKKAQEKAQAEADAKAASAAAAAEKKRKRDEEEAALQARIAKKPKLDTTDGFTTIDDAHRRKTPSPPPQAASGVGALLQSLRGETQAEEGESSDDGGVGGGGLGGLMGAYDSDES